MRSDGYWFLGPGYCFPRDIPMRQLAKGIVLLERAQLCVTCALAGLTTAAVHLNDSPLVEPDMQSEVWAAITHDDRRRDTWERASSERL